MIESILLIQLAAISLLYIRMNYNFISFCFMFTNLYENISSFKSSFNCHFNMQPSIN